MDIRLEYDKAKAVKWLMAPGLIGISAEEIAAAHGERNMREIARCMQLLAVFETPIHFIFIFETSLTFLQESRRASCQPCRARHCSFRRESCQRGAPLLSFRPAYVFTWRQFHFTSCDRAHQVGAVFDFKPTFDVYLNDAWRVRKEVRSASRSSARNCASSF